MADEALTKETILDAAESVLRKFGPAKANMSDIARALGVSHAALYRHYDSKSALRQAVVERWLRSSFEPLSAVLAETGTAEQRLYRWLNTLRNFKRERAQSDPELFTIYAALVAETDGALESHIEGLLVQLTSIIEDGKSLGNFACEDARQAAVAVFVATTRFHHAAHAAEWSSTVSDSRFEAVWQMIMNGLRAKS